jgi:hypothetical protein
MAQDKGSPHEVKEQEAMNSRVTFLVRVSAMENQRPM